jgi:HTH domain
VPAALSLYRHVQQGTFRARNGHGDLLLGERLEQWPELLELQDAYRSAIHPLERRAIALQFERMVGERRRRHQRRLADLNARIRDFNGLVVDLVVLCPSLVLYLPLLPEIPPGEATTETAVARFLRRDAAHTLARDGLSVAEIAERLLVSERTIRRDLATELPER